MEQTGPLVSPAVLPKLSDAQLKRLQMAKKYCLDVSAKFQQQMQSEQQVIQMAALQEAANRQRALMLMSRIYVGSINFELGDDSVRTAFTPFGAIKSINMSWDSVSMKHKGYSFLEYETAEAAQLALEQMNGVVIGGRNIKVGRPNNVPQAAPIIAHIQQEALKYPRIYVASIHADLSKDDVRSVFEAFGTIKKVELAPDNTPDKHRGWGFIDYDNHKSAQDAIASMNLFDLGGQFLRVGRALTPPLPLYPPNAGPILPGTNLAAQSSLAAIAAATTVGGAPMLVVPDMKSLASASTLNVTVPLKAEKKPEEEKKKPVPPAVAQDVVSLQQEENVSISGSNARLLIMKKLSRKTQSKVMVLQNMVTSDDLDEDLEEEVTSECSKHGPVDRVIIYKEKQGTEDDADVIIKIFVEFSAPEGADTAIKSLDGRWFGGKMIQAKLYDQDKFEANDLSH